MKQPKICVAGSSNMDLVTSVKRMPLPGRPSTDRFSYFLGGKGANQAIMAAKLGGRVTMIAKVGNDGFGQHVSRKLSKIRFSDGLCFRYG
jgi:ribokinase